MIVDTFDVGTTEKHVPVELVEKNKEGACVSTETNQSTMSVGCLSSRRLSTIWRFFGALLL